MERRAVHLKNSLRDPALQREVTLALERPARRSEWVGGRGKESNHTRTSDRS